MPISRRAKNIIVNLAVGGDFGGDPNGSTVFPQTMLVDYVRVWQPQVGLIGRLQRRRATSTPPTTSCGDRWMGQNGIGLAADGSGNGSIGPEDYDVWRANFGGSFLPAAASVAAFAVPEPAMAVPMAISLMLMYAQRLRCGVPQTHRLKDSP